jgi:DNA-binding MarR family transcriptional regulator
MERDGLVRKLQSSKDRRSVRLRLTERADEVAERIGLSPLDLVDRVLAVLSSDEQRQFAGMLEKLERAMFEELGALDSQIKRRRMAESR